MNIQTLLIAGITLTALAFTVYVNVPKTENKQYYEEFLEFKSKFNKLHSSPQEMEYRYSVFVENMKQIEAHNQTNSTYELGINQFSDLTWEEFKQGYLAEPTPNPSFTTEGPGLTDVKPIDWRKEKLVTPVKNQGQCGSCWAFSTTGSFEGYLAQKDKKLPSLSEQELVDCSRSYGNMGCNGGLMTYAYNYIKDHKLGTEKDYPYRAYNQSCKRKDSGNRYEIKEYTVLTNPNVKNLSNLLAKRPVSVAIEVNSKFMHYKSGVFAFDASCGYRLNHGVLLVGQEKNYYIVKNSWGTSWGDKGYIKMEIGTGSGNCGIANKWDVLPGKN